MRNTSRVLMKKRDWLPWKYEIVPWMTKAFTPVKSRSLSNKMKHDFVIVSWTLKVSIFLKVLYHFENISLNSSRFIIPIIYFSTEYPHKFTSKLKGQNVVEHDQCEFEIDVEASDAEVTWCLNGKPIQADDSR